MKKLLLLFIVFFLPAIHSEASSIRAVVDKTEMTPEETLTLSVIINDGRGDVDLRPITDFQVLSSGSSSSYKWINGKTINEYKLTYVLSPVKTGRLVIPSLSADIRGKKIATEPITILVNNQVQADRDRRDVFVTATVTEKQPFKGQQIIYTFSLYYAVNLSDLSLQLPDFQGFTAKELDDEIKRRVVVGGRQYHVIEKKVILIPEREGVSTIPPSVLTCRVPVERKNSRDPFDSFFNDSFFSRTRSERKVLRTNPLETEVKQLPVSSNDERFSGVVGSVTMTAFLEKRELKTGDSMTLSVVVEGTGNIMDVEMPDVLIPDGFKVYKDNPEEKLKEGVNGYAGKKIFGLALVAVKPGSYIIPEIKFNYFDINQKKYKILTAGPFDIIIKQSEDSGELNYVDSGAHNGPLAPGVIKKKVEYTGHDLLPLKEGLDALVTVRRLSFIQYMIILFIPVLLVCCVKLFLLITHRNETAGVRMAKRAESELKRAGKKDITEEAFLSGVYKTIIFKIRSKTSSAGETLTTVEAEKILSDAGSSDDLIHEVTSLITHIESIRFSGRKLDEQGRMEILGRTKQLFRKLK